MKQHSKEEEMNELERTKKALELALATLENHCVGSLYQGYRDQINAILHPAPEMEEVEVERFLIFYKDGSVSHAITREGLQEYNCQGCTVKRVAHTVERPVPQKVERSVSVEARVFHQGYVPAFPFKDYPETHGKQVTLAATWTDYPKKLQSKEGLRNAME